MSNAVMTEWVKTTGQATKLPATTKNKKTAIAYLAGAMAVNFYEGNYCAAVINGVGS